MFDYDDDIDSDQECAYEKELLSEGIHICEDEED